MSTERAGMLVKRLDYHGILFERMDAYWMRQCMLVQQLDNHLNVVMCHLNARTCWIII